MKVVCAIYDRAARMYNQPQVFQAAGVAIRVFTDEVNRAAEDNGLYRHPDDYDLYKLADFDEDNGIFICKDLPQVLVRGKDVVAVKEPVPNLKLAS